MDKWLPMASITPVGGHRQFLAGSHPCTLSCHLMECSWYYCLTCSLPGRMQDRSNSWGHRALVRQFQWSGPLRHFHLWLDETVLLGSVQRTLLPSAKISILVRAEQMNHWGPLGRLLLQWLWSCNMQRWECQQTNLSDTSAAIELQASEQQWWKVGAPPGLKGMAQHDTWTGCHSGAGQCAQQKAKQFKQIFKLCPVTFEESLHTQVLWHLIEFSFCLQQSFDHG